MFGKKKKDDLLAELEELGFHDEGDDEAVKELEEKNAKLAKEIEALKAKNQVYEQEKKEAIAKNQDLQLTVEKMEKELASIEAIPADYEGRVEEIERLNKKIETLKAENKQLTTNLEFASNRAMELTQRLEMQTVKMESNETENNSSAEFAELQTKYQQVKDQLATLKCQQAKDDLELTKNELADVLIEAKSKAKEIVRKAEFDAHDIKLKSEEELAELRQGCIRYQNYIEKMRNDSISLLDQLLQQSQRASK